MIRKAVMVILLLISVRWTLSAQGADVIAVSTIHSALVFKVDHQHLEQVYLGKALGNINDYAAATLPGAAAYSTFGTDNLFSAAIRVTHADGNPSLDLQYVSHSVKRMGEDITLTSILLKDPQYPFEVTLYYKAYYKEDIIEQWATIRHQEKSAVTLFNFASADLNFRARDYWLTQFHGDWAKEMQEEDSRLTPGIKIIDSKLGTRADMYQSPSFFLSLDRPSDENSGKVLAGTLAWTGNFQLLFEIDEENRLRVLSGMNPYASEYRLDPDTTFTTPPFIFTYSDQGKGLASRNLHRWARKYALLDGDKPRMVLLNNWEATYFNFNENKLDSLFDDAKKIGVDMFLLDDGWFGNKYPRDNDRAGLGDWQENKQKLPDGISYLVKQAGKRNIKFGIWIEPEMVNPKSELYEQHPDWILRLPNRPENYFRNQLVLDLTNPKVQDFVYNVVDGLMTNNPGLAYFKWDCNRMMTDAYSPYLKNEQSHLYIDYVQGLYKVFKRIREKYPHLPMMLCSGGGGRVDYGALPYFTEFWPSDNTNPMKRIFIQWGYSYFFPSIALCDHVTGSGDYSLKFKLDVAMMGKLGFDLQLSRYTDSEVKFMQEAVKTYKRIADIIWFGDLYRLISPYKEDRAALQYVNESKTRSVLFVYMMQQKLGDNFGPVRLQGLEAGEKYIVKEINLPEGKKSAFPFSGQSFTGDYLMKAGLNIPLRNDASSAVFEISME